MRTTLDIDDDILTLAKDLAKAEGKTMGQVISDLARRALTGPTAGGFAEAQAGFAIDDWPLFQDHGGMPITNEMIKKIQLETELQDGIAWDHERDVPRTFDDGKAGPDASPRPRKPSRGH